MSTSSFSSIVQNVFRNNGSWKRIKAELSVYYWPRVAGVEIEKKVTAERYFNGYLFLKTESPTLAHQLTMMSPDIIKRFERILGPNIIKGLKIKIGSIHRESPAQEKVEKIHLSNEDQHLIEKSCQEITDPDLAERFKQIMERALLTKHQQLADHGGFCQSCNVIIDRDYGYCPVCETKLKEELTCYIAFLKKHNQPVHLSNLPLEMNVANERIIRQILNIPEANG